MTQTAVLRFTLRTSTSECPVRLRVPVRETLLNGTAVEWLPDLIEGLVRAGRRDEARSALTKLGAVADETREASALAAAARCRGLLASDESFAVEFNEALAWHSRTPTPFERARTELCFGERLRRARRRAESRKHLRAALDTFKRLGAGPWAERARRELDATGETIRRHALSGAEDLTPQELEIALLVASGATNKEVGAALFLSRRRSRPISAACTASWRFAREPSSRTGSRARPGCERSDRGNIARSGKRPEERRAWRRWPSGHRGRRG